MDKGVVLLYTARKSHTLACIIIMHHVGDIYITTFFVIACFGNSSMILVLEALDGDKMFGNYSASVATQTLKVLQQI